jgi:hypothetical protein
MSFSPWAAVGGLIVVLSLWSADHSRLSRDAALEARDALMSRWNDLADDRAYLELELENRTQLQKRLAEISRATQQLSSALDGQTALINRNLSEIKRNDKAVFDYLRGAVPVALGMRYARPETTDPAQWRAAAAAGVHPDSVSPAGASAPGSN